MGNILRSSSDSPRSESTNYPTFTYREREYTYIGDHEQELEDFKCAICLNVLDRPLQTSCGHLFCDECLDAINDNCPTCRGNFTTTPDGFVARKIGGISVECPNEGRGCLWTGTLRESEDHLGIMCDYEEVQCENCDHQGDRKEVNCLHPTWCEEFPLRCPNQPVCRANLTRATLEDHLEQCPEQLLACKFAPAGCTRIVNRKNFDEHLRVDCEIHDQMWRKRIEHLSSVLLSSQLHTAGSDSSEIDEGMCYIPWLCNPCLKEQPTPPYILAIDCHNTFISGRFEADSDPFYSHAGGYKFQLHVVVSMDRGNTYINASVHLLEGGNDGNLMFPFKSTLTLSLMNQHIDGEHKQRVLEMSPQFSQRGNHGTIEERPNSFSIAPRCRWKESSSSAPSYVVDGRLYIKVSSFEFDRGYMSSCVHV